MATTEKTYPDWVQAFRTKGTTVKKRGDAYYLYKRTSRRVAGKKYPQPVDTYIGLITPDGVIESVKKKINITTAEVKEYGFSKALKELCPLSWKEVLADEWEDVFLHIIKKYSPRSYLLKDVVLKEKNDLHCSLSAQFGLFSRKFYKENKIDVEDLKCLDDIYIIYIDRQEIISKISDPQKQLIEQLGLDLEVY